MAVALAGSSSSQLGCKCLKGYLPEFGKLFALYGCMTQSQFNLFLLLGSDLYNLLAALGEV